MPPSTRGGWLNASRKPIPMKTPGIAAGSTASKSSARSTRYCLREVRNAATSAIALVSNALPVPTFTLFTSCPPPAANASRQWSRVSVQLYPQVRANAPASTAAYTSRTNSATTVQIAVSGQRKNQGVAGRASRDPRPVIAVYRRRLTHTRSRMNKPAVGTRSRLTTTAAPLRSARPSIRNHASVARRGRLPAMTMALPKSASTVIATMSMAAARPGRARGAVTVRKSVHSPAPRSRAAYSSVGLIASST